MGADGVKFRINGEPGDHGVADGCPCNYAGRMGKNMGPMGLIEPMGVSRTRETTVQNEGNVCPEWVRAIAGVESGKGSLPVQSMVSHKVHSQAAGKPECGQCLGRMGNEKNYAGLVSPANAGRGRGVQNVLDERKVESGRRSRGWAI